MPGSIRGRHISGEASQEILLPAPNTSQDAFSFPQPKRVSQQSPAQTTFRTMGPLRTPVKSQYPRDSAQSHVEFILVASFDILKGATMEHQYPGEISSDEHMLAELMLPDQAHNRAQDWTIFFLHKDTSGDEEQSLNVSPQKLPRSNGRARPESPNGRPRDSSGEISSDNADVEEEKDMEGPPLIYVLNLVSTKKDDTVARYAFTTACVPFPRPNVRQKCSVQSNGYMYTSSIFAHIQGEDEFIDHHNCMLMTIAIITLSS